MANAAAEGIYNMSDNSGTGRRGFIKGVVAGVSLPGVAPLAGAQAQRTAAPAAAERIHYPRSYSGRQLAMIAFPLGGIGTGSISLGGRGQLRDWEIFNRPDKGHSPDYAFPSIWVKRGVKEAMPSPWRACWKRA